MFSQIIPTKEQAKRIKILTTPEKLIEYSKGLSNEELLTKKYDSLVEVIKLKDIEIRNLIKDHKATLIEIATANSRVDVINTDIDNNTEALKPSFPKLSLYGSVEIPQVNFNKAILSLDLLMDLKIIELGVSLNAFPEDDKLNFNYGIKARYKFF